MCIRDRPYTVPKDGAIEYTYFVVPSGFTQDTWVTDAEIRPGNRKVCLLYTSRCV